MTVNTLIEYSSHDKQEKLEEIIIYFLGLLDNSTKTTNVDLNVIKEQQSTIALSIHFSINKLIKVINTELAKKLYEILVLTFKQRGGIYDEAILVVSSLAISNIFI